MEYLEGEQEKVFSYEFGNQKFRQCSSSSKNEGVPQHPKELLIRIKEGINHLINLMESQSYYYLSSPNPHELWRNGSISFKVREIHYSGEIEIILDKVNIVGSSKKDRQ